jgi:hypothetical protein
VTASDGNGNGSWKHRPDDLSWREIDEEVIVLDLRAASYLRLNRAGALLWNRLVTWATVPQLAHTLADRFGLDAGQAQADAASFVESCASLDLLVGEHP